MDGMGQGAVQVAAPKQINRTISRKSEIDDVGASANKRAFTQEEINIQDRQEYEIDQIEEFSSQLKRIEDPAYRLGSDDSPNAIENRQRTIEDVRRYVREDKPSSTVSKKELKAREKRYQKKVKLASRSHSVKDEFEREILNQESKLLREHRENEALGGPQGDPIREKYQIDAIAYIDSLDVDALAYKDDEEFLKKSSEWMLQITKAEKYAELFTGELGEEAYTQYFNSIGITDLEIRDKVKGEIEEKLTITLANQKEYILKKLELIQSPYYALLSKADLDELTLEELYEKAEFFEQLRKPALARYIRTFRELKAMTDPEGALKLTRSRTVKSSNSRLVRGKNGKQARVTTKTEKWSHEGHQTLNGSTIATPHKFGTEKASDGRDTYSKRKAETRTRTANKDGEYGEEVVDKVKDSTTDKLSDVAGQALSSLGLTYNVGGSISARKGTIARKTAHTEISATGSLLSGSVSGGVGATLFNKDGEIAPNFSLDLSGEVNVAEGEVTAAAKRKYEGTEWILAQANAKLKGAFGKLKGKIGGSVGKIKYKKKGDDGTDQTVEEWGVTFNASGGAYLATGAVSGTAGVLGIAATLKAEGSIGIGGSFKYVHSTGRIQVSVGVVLGVGGKLSFTIDYGNAIDSLKRATIDRFVKFCRKKYKSSRREKYGAHKPERGFNLGANAYRLAHGVDVI